MKPFRASTACCEQEEAKKLFASGPLALALPKPLAQSKKVLGSFFSKAILYL
jgi:hypothetical protein